jgi:hypothetical protein
MCDRQRSDSITNDAPGGGPGAVVVAPSCTVNVYSHKAGAEVELCTGRPDRGAGGRGATGQAGVGRVQTTTQTSKRCEVVVCSGLWIELSDRNARGQDTNTNPKIRDHSAHEAAPPLRPTGRALPTGWIGSVHSSTQKRQLLEEIMGLRGAIAAKTAELANVEDPILWQRYNETLDFFCKLLESKRAELARLDLEG